MPNKDDELDRILDSALASYSTQEPWPGLTQRIVARLEPGRRAGWLRWSLPLAAAAGILLAVLWWGGSERPAVAVVPEVPKTQPAQPVTAAVAVPPQRHQQAAKRPALARRRVFPTPSPITEEERALLRLVTSSPPEVVDELRTSREHVNQALTVEPLFIAPLGNGG